MATNDFSPSTLPHAVRVRLSLCQHDLEYAPGSIAAVLDLAYTLLHNSELTTADPSPLASQANLAALVDCARLATRHLEMRVDSLLEAMDSAGGAA